MVNAFLNTKMNLKKLQYGSRKYIKMHVGNSFHANIRKMKKCLFSGTGRVSQKNTSYELECCPSGNLHS